MNLILGRRALLRSSTLAGAGLLVPASAVRARATSTAPQFAHGVASGDPLPDGVVLWTRVTPTPDATPGSGTGPAVDVGWEVAADRRFTRVVRSGAANTGPERDHTVKVDVRGLSPSTTYWYRFSLDGVRSPAARTRTAPGPDTSVDSLRLGVVSCANWQGGYFSAYRHLAARRDLDAVLHLGDYLYEYGVGEYGARSETVRPHEPPDEMTTLADYRRRHAQYKTDPDLQALHAAHPFVVVWDDHESANDAWRDGAENHTEGAEGTWAQRKAISNRVYAEWMPVRYDPAGPVYRRLRFGRLAELSMLDLRSYRDRQAGPTELHLVDDPSRTITGETQMGWLRDGLVRREAQWGLVGNPVMIAPLLVPPLPSEVTRPVNDPVGLLPPEGMPFNPDQWDGYTADRYELLHALADQGTPDTVFLTGDIHSSWANDLPLDAGTYPASRSVATEMVGTSVTSDNIDDITGTPPRTASVSLEQSIKATNRHVRYVELDSHGYSVLDVTPARVQMDWYYISDRTDPDATARWAAGWATVAGSQQVQQAGGPA